MPTLRIKRRSQSSEAPTTLVNAELAFNENSEILYYGKGVGAGNFAASIIPIAGKGAFADLSSTQSIGGSKTFTGSIFVPAPTQNTHASTKLYVDNQVATKANTAHTHAASDITSGIFAAARLGSGENVTTKYLRGDGTWQTIEAVAGAHTHGNITNEGAIGTISGLPIITTTNGVLTTGAFGTSAGTFCQGNDSRLSDARTPLAHTHPISDVTNLQAVLDGKASSTHTHAASDVNSGTFDIARIPTGTTSTTVCIGNDARLSDARTPTSHTHGNITNAGAIGSTANLPLITTTSGVITTGSFGTAANTFCQGNDSRLSDARTPTAHNHSASEITSGTLSADRIPGLDASKITTGTIDAARLPSYVDDVLEFNSTNDFPVNGETGKIYISLATNKTYRWSGSAYVYITSGAVDSVAGKTGIVTLDKSDVGLGNVDNTADANKNVLTATKWATARTLSFTGDATGSGSVDGSQNVATGLTLANSGVTAGTYTKLTVDVKGRATAGTTLADTDIPNLAASKTTSGTFDIARIPTGTTSTTVCIGNDARLSDARTPTSHTHGNITNAGAIGSTANLPIITTTSGVLTTGSFGTAANTFCQGNDSRLSDARTPTAHTHAISEITNLQTTLDGKAASSHTHAISDVTNLQTTLDGKASTNHTHGAADITSGTFDILRIPTGTTSSTVCIGNDSRLSDARTPTSHTHGNITNAGAIGSTANLPVITTTSGVLTTGTFGTAANTFCQGNDSRLSDARTPTAHTHAISEITNLQTTLDGKAATSHTHAISDVTNLQTTLDGKLSNATNSTQAGYFGDIYLWDDSTPSHYLQITNSANLTAARVFNLNVNDANRTVSLSGDLTVSANATISGTNTGDQTITLTGDVTGSGTGSFATTLANTAVTPGSYTAATLTVDAKGRITAASSNTIPTVNNGTLTLAVSGTGLSGSQTFTANQSGNATFTVTSNATDANTASTIVARDASGNFSAGTVTLNGLTVDTNTLHVDATNDRVGIGTTTPGYKLEVNGSFAATTKSFVIDHPTKPGKRLRYGSLEGPENGVYVRGRSNSNIIWLPDYWKELVDADTITVNITPIGRAQNLWVAATDAEKVTIYGSDTPEYYYTVYGERKDVPKLVVEE